MYENTDNTDIPTMKALQVDVKATEIDAQNYFGARHALESLSQFWGYSEEINKNSQSTNPWHFVVLDDVSISDGPEFKHRGALIDTSRNFVSKVF